MTGARGKSISARLALGALLCWAPIGSALCEAQCLVAETPQVEQVEQVETVASVGGPSEARSHCDHATSDTATPGATSGASSSDEMSCHCGVGDWASDSRSVAHSTDVGHAPVLVLLPLVEHAATTVGAFRAAAPPGLNSPYRYQHRPLLI